MPSDAFIEKLNEQIGYEFSAERQYIAIAAHYDAQTLPRLATLFYKQALEERNHAMMMVKYLLDRDAAVKIPGVDEPRGDFGSEQFMHWFVKEQVEEVSKMSALLDVVERARENPLLAEDYLARETPGDQAADPTAPPAAGGAL